MRLPDSGQPGERRGRKGIINLFFASDPPRGRPPGAAAFHLKGEMIVLTIVPAWDFLRCKKTGCFCCTAGLSVLEPPRMRENSAPFRQQADSTVRAGFTADFDGLQFTDDEIREDEFPYLGL